MLKGKKVTDYLAYAVGEIILVVFGILIALWINNWNKEQQLKTSNRNLQDKVLGQLNRDIKDIVQFSKELDTLDQVYLKILDRDYNKLMVDENKVISTILFDVKDLGLSQQNINWIDNAQLDDTKISEKLVNLGGLYKLYFKNINDIEIVAYNKITKNLEYLEANKPWYTELITDFNCKDDCLEYLTRNEEHRARIASLRLIYIFNYGDLVNGFYNDLLGAKKELESVIEQSH